MIDTADLIYCEALLKGEVELIPFLVFRNENIIYHKINEQYTKFCFNY